MNDAQTVTFYLPQAERKKALRGNHNFIAKMGAALEDAGLAVDFDSADADARERAKARPGRSLFLMNEPVNNRGLTFRKTYLYPFWHIEKQGKRWLWPVAQTSFDPRSVRIRKARNFQRFWKERLFEHSGGAPVRDGFVYMPLQERLLDHRSFQSCRPIDMIKAVLERDPNRFVLATLHPTGVYTAAEQAMLEQLLDQHDRLFLRVGGSEKYLKNCDYIVTQNSSVGFLGYFFGKPLILFGQSDFHHIALNVQDIGVDAAFDAVQSHAPNYAAYLFWFLQQQAINAGRLDAEIKIRNVFEGHGWPV